MEFSYLQITMLLYLCNLIGNLIYIFFLHRLSGYLLLMSDSTFSVDWRESIWTFHSYLRCSASRILSFWTYIFPMLLVKMTLKCSFPLVIFLFSPSLYVLKIVFDVSSCKSNYFPSMLLTPQWSYIHIYLSLQLN